MFVIVMKGREYCHLLAQLAHLFPILTWILLCREKKVDLICCSMNSLTWKCSTLIIFFFFSTSFILFLFRLLSFFFRGLGLCNLLEFGAIFFLSFFLPCFLRFSDAVYLCEMEFQDEDRDRIAVSGV